MASVDDAIRRTSYRGEPYRGPKFRDFLKTVGIGESLTIARATKAQWPSDDVDLRVCCYLGNDWGFDEIEGRAKQKPAYLFQGTAGKHVDRILRVVCDLERALRKTHPKLPVDAVADFWRSSQVASFLREFCYYLFRDPNALLSAGERPETAVEGARFFAWLQLDRYVRGEVGNDLKAGPITASEPTVSGHESTGRKHDPVAVERRARVEAYRQDVLEKTGNRITRKEIWRKAGYESATEFQRWQRNDPRTTLTANRNFERILSEKPHLK